jgi:hypothetical protein
MKDLIYNFSFSIIIAVFVVSCSDHATKSQIKKSSAEVVSSSTETGEEAMRTSLESLEKIRGNPGTLEMYTIENGKKIPVDIEEEIEWLKKRLSESSVVDDKAVNEKSQR